MAEDNAQQIPMEQSQSDYHAETPTPLQDAIGDAEQSVTATAADVNAAKERAAFETYVQSTGGEVPENFDNAGSWFDSLKEAQANYTRGQQEIAGLREQLTQAPTSTPPTEAPTTPVDDVSVSDELRIEVNQPESETQPDNAMMKAVSQDDWTQWQYEVATTGDLLPQTKQEIMTKTGLNETMVNDFLGAQKSRMREAKAQAATSVGGTKALDDIFRWATSNLSQAEQYSINAGLADNGMQDITLMGLKAKYDKAMSAKPIAKEPVRNIPAEPVSSTAPAYQPYRTAREFKADRNNPRFGIEPDYRYAVEQRMSLTNFNNLPE